MTDTDTDLIESLISRLDTEFASEDYAAIRAAARRLQATDPDLARIAESIADLSIDIDRRTGGEPLDPRPNRLSMGDQLTLVTDTGRIDGRIRQIWIGNTNITEAVTSDGLKFTGDADGNRIIAEATLAVLGPITSTAEETLA